MSNIALIGPKLMIEALAGAGIDLFPSDSTLQSRTSLKKILTQEKHAIVFLIERYALELTEEIEEAENQGLAVVLLPDHRGSIGLFKENLENLIKKATGALKHD